MMSKEAKKNYVEDMKKNFTDNESVMIAQYQGLNVNELDALRKELRDKGILFKITNSSNVSEFDSSVLFFSPKCLICLFSFDSKFQLE